MRVEIRGMMSDEVLATVRLVDGVIVIDTDRTTLRKDMELGISGLGGVNVLPSEGEKFLKSLRYHYSGAYVRAYEIPENEGEKQ